MFKYLLICAKARLIANRFADLNHNSNAFRLTINYNDNGYKLLHAQDGVYIDVKYPEGSLRHKVLLFKSSKAQCQKIFDVLYNKQRFEKNRLLPLEMSEYIKSEYPEVYADLIIQNLAPDEKTLEYLRKQAAMSEYSNETKNSSGHTVAYGTAASAP